MLCTFCKKLQIIAFISLFLIGDMLPVLAQEGAAKEKITQSEPELETQEDMLPWIKQFGTTQKDTAAKIATDLQGNIYVVGETTNDLPDPENRTSNGWIYSYTPEGKLRWSKQVDSKGQDAINDIVISPTGTLYLCGVTSGLLGEESFGKQDGLVISMDADGNEVWRRQFGDVYDNLFTRMALGKTGDIFVAGMTETPSEAGQPSTMDVWFYTVNSKGEVVADMVFGSTGINIVTAIAVYDEQVYLGGTTTGMFEEAADGGTDNWISYILPYKEQHEEFQFGSDEGDLLTGLHFDEQGVFYAVTNSGISSFGLSGKSDITIYSFEYFGSTLWQTTISGNGNNPVLASTFDSDGNLIVAGLTDNTIGTNRIGALDSWVAAFDKDGAQLWLDQLGTESDEVIATITVDKSGDLLLAGTTRANLTADATGTSDAWMARFQRSGRSIFAVPNAFTLASAIASPPDDLLGRIVFLSTRNNSSTTNSENYPPHNFFATLSNGRTLQQLGKQVLSFSFGYAVSPTGDEIITGLTKDKTVPIYALDGQIKREIPTPFQNYAQPQGWSPDGSKVLVLGNSQTIEHSIDLYILDLETETFSLFVQDPERVLAAAWSPDGSQVVYATNFDIWLIDADGNNKQHLVKHEALSFTWSGDGKFIVFEGWRRPKSKLDLWKINIDGSGLTNLTDTPERDEQFPSLSPDSTQLAFDTYSEELGATQIHILDLVNGTERLLTRSNTNRHPFWVSGSSSPDPIGVLGRRQEIDDQELTYIADGNLWLSDEAGQTRLLSGDESIKGHVSDYAWSSTGEEIALLSHGNVYRMRVDDSSLTQITTAGDITDIDWKQGRLALFRSLDDNHDDILAGKYILSVIDSDYPAYPMIDISDELEILAIGGGGADPTLALSPDGKWVVLSYLTAYGIAATDGSKFIEKWTVNPSWRNDSSELLFVGQAFNSGVADQPGIWAWNPETNSERQISTIEASYANFSPSDRYIAYAAPYLTISSDDTNSTYLTIEDRALNPIWSPQGDYIVYQNWKPDPEFPESPYPVYQSVYVHDLRTGNQRLLSSEYVYNYQWKPLTDPQVAYWSFDVAFSPSTLGNGSTASTASATQQFGVVKTEGEKLNVRSGPGVNNKLITQIRDRSPVTILSQNVDGSWLQIQYAEGQTGWVSAQFIELMDTAATPLPQTSVDCQVAVDPNFEIFWQDTSLGCPRNPSSVTWAAYQEFQLGFMVWREDLQHIAVYYITGQVSIFDDDWDGNEMTGYRGAPPEGLISPKRGFGAVWMKDGIFDALGWANGPEKGFCLLVQNFEEGIMFKSTTGDCSGQYNYGNEEDVLNGVISVNWQAEWTTN